MSGALDFVVGLLAPVRATMRCCRSVLLISPANLANCAGCGTEEQIRRWVKRRIDIETDEPPLLYALETWCDNEVCRAWRWDHEGLVPLTRRQRLMMNWLTFERTEFPDRIKPNKEGPGSKSGPLLAT